MSSPGAGDQHLRGQGIDLGFIFLVIVRKIISYFLKQTKGGLKKKGGSFGNYPEKMQQITQNALHVTEKEASQLTSQTRGLGKRKMTNTYLFVRPLCLSPFSLLYRIS